MALGLSLGGVGSVAGWSLCRSHLCYKVQVFRIIVIIITSIVSAAMESCVKSVYIK